ncbi:hypothetical protein [Sulfolobus acidocaldarius]|uniref:Conserved conjugative plasmid protein n=4 Tax=Sulfolobus acidocaldarius TaxID=2285 RepID=Q4JBB2_SULAC|nr:hypothetical protein [Sulfolobus acidocaldarius]AAY79917.1 conserved conjugative plasmid protein [Sulfolobus acidocaldarius DSM 639]AGE70482.1 conjugative plasmid protein [Sulfolobus acidocaldarius N8]AGE72755.1 conjugative plasmid protein [Sulfolobus acidocaldarius Ron12/I]ALU29143.1 conjugal transfer protein [Sulfolobus acidocaldarius]ALU31869.1 conjugal transfer protein [Sulfolobus acidocaldarius]
MFVVKAKDPKDIIKLAKQYSDYPMELILYINNPRVIGGLRLKRKVEIIRAD